jgi:hypothetical protein
MFAFWMMTFSQFVACKGCQETKVNDIDTGNVEGFSNNWGKWLDMTSNADGQPLIAYYDTTHGALGLATGTITDNGVSWTHEEIDGYPNEQGLDEGDRGAYTSMAVDSAGTIWIAYYDAGLKTLRYATRTEDATEWTLGVADTGGGGTPDAGLFTEMALDGTGSPVIVHYDQFRGDLRVAHWDGSRFNGEVVDSGEDYDDGEEVVSADTGKFASIAIVDGLEYISYYDVAAGNLMLAKGIPGGYSTEVVDVEGDVGSWTSMTIDNGTVNISYQDKTNDSVKLATGTPGSWSNQIVEQGKLIGADTALLNTDNGLMVLYQDAYNNDIRLAEENGTTWNTRTLDGVDSALGFHNQVAIIDGVVYAACYNFTTEKVWFSTVSN